MSPKGRTELRIGVSEAKFHEETEFDIRSCLAPQNPSKKSGKLISETQNNLERKKRGEKMKCGESSETCACKVSGYVGLV